LVEFLLFYPTTIPHAELDAPEESMKEFPGKLLPEATIRKPARSSAAFAAMVTLLDKQVGEDPGPT